MKIIISFLFLMSSVYAYVGDKACQECHKTQNKLWKGSHHELAMQVVSEKSVLGDFNNAHFEYNGIVSTFYKKGKSFMVKTDGADGKLQDFEIKYVFGLYPLQQYMIPFDDGRIQVLDIAWDSRPQKEGGERWYHLHPHDDVKSGDVLHWSGPNLNWNYMCADCHSTNLKKNYNAEKDTYNTTYSAINVSCEACHGEGESHVKGPKKHSFSEMKIETCAKCHSRRSQIGDDFHKNSRFSDNYKNVFLEEDLYYSDGKIKDEVYVYNSFLQSKMYEEGVTCKNCHDPHSLKLKGGREGVCFSCHEPKKYATEKHSFHKSVDCVSCHMPPKIYMGVDSRNDHSFRVPRPDLSVGSDIPNACNICHKEKDASWAQEALKSRGKMRIGKQNFSHELTALRKGSFEAPQLLYDILLGDAPQIAKATAASHLGDYPTKQTYFTTMQLLRNSDELTRLGALHSLEKFPLKVRIKQNIKMLEDESKIVRIEAAKQLAQFSQGDMPQEVSVKLESALDEYEKSLLFTAERAESQSSLANLYANLKRYEEAESAYKRALKIQAKYIPAYVNYANYLQAQNREEEVYKVINRGLEEVADSAILHHILGLYYIRTKQQDKAILALEKAADLDKDDARIQYVYAVALADTDTKKAIAVLESSLQKHSGDLQTLYALGYYYSKLGDQGKADLYNKKAQRFSEFTPKQ